MKKILSFVLTSALLIACGPSKKEYNDNLGKTIERMASISDNSSIYVSQQSKVWHTAIFDHKDHTGSYCHDFNEVLARYNAAVKELPIYSEDKERFDSLKREVRELRNYPAGYDETYSELVSIYTDVEEYYQLGIEPKGSLQDYNRHTSELYSSIRKRLKSFKLKYIEGV